MREVDKRVNEGRELIAKNPEHDLKVSDMQELYAAFKEMCEAESLGDAVFELIAKTFDMGVSVGAKIANGCN